MKTDYKKFELGDLVEIISGYAYKSEYFNSNKIGMPLIRIRDVERGYTDTYFDGEYDNNYVIKKNELLITMDGNFILKKWIGEPALLNQRVCKVMVKDLNLSSDYLSWILPRYLKIIEDKTPFVTVKHLSVKKIKEIELILPPFDVQKQIANTLGLAFELIEKRKEQLVEMDRLIRSIFHLMFLSKSNQKNVKLEGYINFLTSGSRGWAKYYSEVGSYFITIKNVKNSRLNLQNATFVNPPKNKEAERTKVKEGDLLISITADLGRTAVVDKETAKHGGHINQHLSLIRLSEEVNPVYLSYYFESEIGKRQFKKLDQVGVKSGLNFAALSSLTFPIYPICVQNEFVSIVEGIETQKNLMEESLHEMEKNFNALMQKALRGEIFPE